MQRHQVHAPIPPFKTVVTSPLIGTGAPLPVTAFAVACYPGEQISFWVQGEGGWLYCYIPIMWLPHREKRPKAYCSPNKSYEFVIEAPPLAKVSLDGEEVEALFVIDYLAANDLAWVVRHADGALAVVQHRHFDATLPVGGLRGLSEVWR